MSMDGVEIIFTDKNHRELLQSGEIEALMKNALLRRSIAKKAHHNVFFLLEFHRVRIADSIRNSGSDHRRGPHDAVGDVNKVHRPALSFRTTCSLAVKLRE